MERVPYVMPGTVKDVFIYFLFYLGLALTHVEPESKRLGQQAKVGQPLAGLASTPGLTPECLSLQPSREEHATPWLPLVVLTALHSCSPKCMLFRAALLYVGGVDDPWPIFTAPRSSQGPNFLVALSD